MEPKPTKLATYERELIGLVKAVRHYLGTANGDRTIGP
jgi:hypothetical protein